jgi:uncharacterized RDD family membrane protein YckC
MKYAGFWIRVLASILDSIVSLVVIVPIIGFLKFGWASVYNDAAAAGIAFIASCIAGWLYYAFFECGSWQATPGKRLLGLRVTDVGGNRIGFGRASGRYFAKTISAFPTLCVGFLMAGITQKKQGLHDKLVDTLVLYGTPDKASVFGPDDPQYATPLSQPSFPSGSNESNQWVMSGFDAEGYAVYLSFNPDNPKLVQEGLIIGRDSKSADLVMNDSSVSRRHARLFRKDGALVLQDLQSANGTVVNGRPLKAGMTVELPRQGNVVLGAVRLSISGW